MKSKQLKKRFDIKNIISKYTDLYEIAKGIYKGLCPFHKEKIPSFIVNTNTQIFYCFGCGVGGDVKSFLMRVKKVDFKKALKYLR